MMTDIEKLFLEPLKSTRTGAFYNTFPYPTKISPEAIAIYIACITSPGAKILDTFGGSGSTGVAALLCEHPTDRMIQLAKDMGVSPEWGKRDAVLYDLGTYAAFASKTITSRIRANEFKETVDKFLVLAEKEVEQYYRTHDEVGQAGSLRYVIWSEVLKCQNCNEEISYFAEGTSRSPVSFKKEITCPICGHTCSVDEMNFATETVYDSLVHKTITRKKRIPAWVYGTSGKRNWDRPADEEDIVQFQNLDTSAFDDNDSPRQIEWGDLHRKGYHFGITYLHQMYTKRNYLVFYKLWKLTDSFEQRFADALKLLLLSYNSAHCTMMTRVVAKHNAKDFVLTSAQSGVLYISKLPVEKNILLGLKRKAKPFIETYRLLEDCAGDVVVKNQSSECLDESSGTIDFVFTDPPFGDFIPYAEVNQINELWLRKVTDRSKEVIMSQAQNKGVREYEKMLATVFKEINRVLKSDAKAVIVFHAAKADVWDAFAKSLNESNLKIQKTNILDKKQSSFKQVVSEGSVKGDPLFLVAKGHENTETEDDDLAILDDIIINSVKQEKVDEKRMYSLYVNECLLRGVKIGISAKEAYAYITKKRGDKG